MQGCSAAAYFMKTEVKVGLTIHKFLAIHIHNRIITRLQESRGQQVLSLAMQIFIVYQLAAGRSMNKSQL